MWRECDLCMVNLKAIGESLPMKLPHPTPPEWDLEPGQTHPPLIGNTHTHRNRHSAFFWVGIFDPWG